MAAQYFGSVELHASPTRFGATVVVGDVCYSATFHSTFESIHEYIYRNIVTWALRKQLVTQTELDENKFDATAAPRDKLTVIEAIMHKHKRYSWGFIVMFFRVQDGKIVQLHTDGQPTLQSTMEQVDSKLMVAAS